MTFKVGKCYQFEKEYGLDDFIDYCDLNHTIAPLIASGFRVLKTDGDRVVDVVVIGQKIANKKLHDIVEDRCGGTFFEDDEFGFFTEIEEYEIRPEPRTFEQKIDFALKNGYEMCISRQDDVIELVIKDANDLREFLDKECHKSDYEEAKKKLLDKHVEELTKFEASWK